MPWPTVRTDRHGTTRIVAAGQGVLLASLILAAVGQSELVFAIGYVAAIGGDAGLAYVPTLVAVQHRAAQRAKLAAGIAGAGVGLGPLFGASFCGLLYGCFGWRLGLALGASTALAAVLAAVALVAPTANTNSTPTGTEAHQQPSQPPVTTGSKADLVHLFGAYALAGIVTYVPFSGLVELGREVGWRPGTAISMIGIVGAGSAIGRLLLGGVTERFGACRVTGASAARCARHRTSGKPSRCMARLRRRGGHIRMHVSYDGRCQRPEGRSMPPRLISSDSRLETAISCSRAVVDGDWVFVSGTTGFDYTTTTIADDVVAQTEQTLRNIGQVLQQAGCSFADVVRVRCILPNAARLASQ